MITCSYTSSALSSFEGMNLKINSLVAIARRSHPFPYRTRKLSFFAPMVVGTQVPVRVGRCQANEGQPDEGCSFFRVIGNYRIGHCG